LVNMPFGLFNDMIVTPPPLKILFEYRVKDTIVYVGKRIQRLSEKEEEKKHPAVIDLISGNRTRHP